MSETGSTAVRRHVGCRTDDRSLRRPTPPGGGTRRGAGARAAVCGSGFFERQSDEPLLPSGVHEEEDGLAFLVARVFVAPDDLGGPVHEIGRAPGRTHVPNAPSFCRRLRLKQTRYIVY